MKNIVAVVFVVGAVTYANPGYTQLGHLGHLLDYGVGAQAGINAANGDISSLGIDFSRGLPESVAPNPPSARDVAMEMFRIQEEKEREREEIRKRSLQDKIRSHIDKSYAREFPEFKD